MGSAGEFQLPPSSRAVPHALELDALAQRIKERDRAAEMYAHAQWLENGRDLLKAKDIVGHGDFGEWCERELSYTARTAQKLMRAAEVCGPYFENESGSHLPKPTIIYLLSAPSVPQEIRDAYASRVIAGEDVGVELRSAIKDHRDAEKKAKERKAHLAATSPKTLMAQTQRERVRALREAREAEEHHIELERQATARSAALALIQTRFGDELPVLIALVAKGGTGSVFSIAAERELQLRLDEMTAVVEEGAGVVRDEPEVADVETVPASATSKGGPPASSMPRNSVDEEHAAAQFPHAPASAEISLPKSNAIPQIANGEFGNLADVVSNFPTVGRDRKLKIT